MSSNIKLFPDTPETENDINDKIEQLEIDAATLKEEMRRWQNSLRFGITCKYVKDLIEWMRSPSEEESDAYAWYCNRERTELGREIRNLEMEIRFLQGDRKPESPVRLIGERKEKLHCEEALKAAQHLLAYWSGLLEKI